MIEIDLMRPPEMSFVDELEHDPDNGEQWQQNVRTDKVASVERRQCAPSLHKR